MYQCLSGQVVVPVHLHNGFTVLLSVGTTAACPEMFHELPFNMTLNILSGLKIQDSIHLLGVFFFFFPFLFIYGFHSLLHSSFIFCKFLNVYIYFCLF